MGAFCLVLLLGAMLATPASATVTRAGLGKALRPEVLEAIARAKLDNKLMDVSQSDEMKVIQHPETKPSPIDPDSGNPTRSRIAFHDRVVPTCLKWANRNSCEKWLSPYVSEHGVQGGLNQSDLESLMGKKNKTDDPLALFDIEKQGGGQILDNKNHLKLAGVSKFALKQEIQNEVSDLGFTNADIELRNVPKAEGQKGNSDEVALPNEVYRVMARNWTQMLRNRLLSKLGAQRAATIEGGEAILDYDMPNCEAYIQAAKNDRGPDTYNDLRIKPQVPLDMQNKRLQANQRYQMCQAMQNASIYTVNPNARGGKLKQGDPNREPIDQALTRINIAMIDNAGLDPNQVPKPGNLAFRREDYASQIADCAPNGKGCDTILQTNAEQINSFNNARAEAYQTIENAAKRSSTINPKGYSKLKEKIAIGYGAQSLIQLNGITPEMKGHLKKGQYVETAQVNNPNGPDNTFEKTPGILVVRSLQ